MSTPLPVTLLDLAAVPTGTTVGQALRDARTVAQAAERLGFERFWMAEHHNMPGIASAATAVALGFVAEGTTTIRVGSGGIMLPNHAPLLVAEQFGTLDALYPGRIDLGLGRAPGTDQATVRALRRTQAAAERFPQDVVELLGLLADPVPNQRVKAVPGAGSKVPVYLLGSSTFSAQLAAHLGLPFAFASHFAPPQLHAALRAYRSGFRPSPFLDKPYAMAAINVYAADDQATAEGHFHALQRRFVELRTGRPTTLGPADHLPLDPELLQLTGVATALSRAAVGTPDVVQTQLAAFVEETQIDELIVTAMMAKVEDRVRNLELLAEVLPAKAS